MHGVLGAATTRRHRVRRCRPRDGSARVDSFLARRSAEGIEHEALRQAYPLRAGIRAGVDDSHDGSGLRALEKQEVTFPADGAVLSASPDVVSMRFDMPMRVTVIPLTSETTGGTFEFVRSDGMRPVTDFRATPTVLPNDRYTVE